MGIIMHAFIFLALISALSCAPTDDDSTLKIPVTAIYTTTTTTSLHHLEDIKKDTSRRDISSADSKESEESSEEHKKRPARDSQQNSGTLAQQTRDLPSDGVIQTPPPVTKEAAQPQLPARETRGALEHDVAPPRVLSAQHGVSTSPTPASTTSKQT